jgi:hypothetical protein
VAAAECRLASGAWRRVAYPLAAVASGAIASVRRSDGTWRLLALWSARGDLGERDPLFHRVRTFGTMNTDVLAEELRGYARPNF